MRLAFRGRCIWVIRIGGMRSAVTFRSFAFRRARNRVYKKTLAPIAQHAPDSGLEFIYFSWLFSDSESLIVERHCEVLAILISQEIEPIRAQPNDGRSTVLPRKAFLPSQ